MRFDKRLKVRVTSILLSFSCTIASACGADVVGPTSVQLTVRSTYYVCRPSGDTTSVVPAADTVSVNQDGSCAPGFELWPWW